jgi:UDP-N-acetyl-D-mannosaminuronic acid dehydrogenase
MGLAFKPDIDDLRESPALAVAESLCDAMFDVVAVEPNIESREGLKLVSIAAGMKDSDIIVFLVKHSQFVSLNTAGKLVLDFCGVTASA